LWRSFYFHFHMLSSPISSYFVFFFCIKVHFSCPPGDSSIYVGFGKCTLIIKNTTFCDMIPCSLAGGYHVQGNRRTLSTLVMEVAGTSAMLTCIHRTTNCHVREEQS
jgi:hypothetical protein